MDQVKSDDLEPTEMQERDLLICCPTVLGFSLIFRFARHWDAILLLDEGDVFLERRSARDVHRNDLVAVSLRKLEYFKGILFLTTNRVSAFDEAILSHIHLTLKHDNLNSKAKRKIWEIFLQIECTDSGAASISDGKLDHVATLNFNG